MDSKKLKSQWKAQKKKQGLLEQPSVHREDPSEDTPDDVHVSTEVEDTAPVHADPPTTSLRDLTRQAYSPSTLHTHKSHPLRKQHGTTSRVHFKDNPASHPPKGQPNMKLRMNAMLEKIKRDLC